jgi:ketosteroid isomerase-like protein
MEYFLNEPAMNAGEETVEAFVFDFYAAIERQDLRRIRELVEANVFVFGAAAEAVSIGQEQFVTSLRTPFERGMKVQLHRRAAQVQVGLCASGRSAWFFDQMELEIVDGRNNPRRIPIRITALLVQQGGWRLVAAFLVDPAEQQRVPV